jgi:alpha-glucosidase
MARSRLLSCRHYLVAVAILAGIAWQEARAEWVRSPDGTIEAELVLRNHAPIYTIRRFGAEVIRPSQLGFVLSGDRPLTTDFEIESIERNSHDQTWTQPWGEKKEIRCNYNELRLLLRQRDQQARQLAIVFRLFDDGVGFRYEFPKQAHLTDVVIVDEMTQFALAAEATAWSIPALQDLRYEYLYKQTPVSELRRVHTPLTCQTADGICLSIHEAALYDFASMTLANVGDRTLKADLVPWSDGVKVRATAPFHTPWRTIQIADSPGELITSYLILNLNEPNRLGDVSWIKPGKYVGVWWEMHLNLATWGSGKKHGANTAHVKRYIDFAAKYGFDGVLVEGWNEGWDGDWYANGNRFNFTKPYPDFDIEQLAAYARDREVFLIGHHETAGGIDNYQRQLEDAYDLYERLGVRAVKSGYVANGQNIERHAGDKVTREWHHGQFMVRHYQHALEEAARHRIMLIAHEPIKATGIRRTFPNMISREGARGQEYNAWAADGGNPPEHTTILPFTRMLAGPMDFTPGVFDILLQAGDRPDNRVNTTLAKQLALYVVLYAPFQMAVDLPEVYQSHLDAFQFIRDVPTDWQDTRVLHASIGDYVAIARKERDAEDWYLGAVTDQRGRSLETPLAFLDRDRTYVAEIYRDADNADWRSNPTAYVIENTEVNANTILNLRLAPGGGQAIRFYPKDP